MTMQCTDPFVWNGKEWIFLGASNVYKLFDPKKYKLIPEMISTACYKGFIIYFRVTDDLLYLDRLIIRCADNNYPPINNIKPENYSEKYYERVMDYKNINLLLPYSGTIIVGSDLLPSFEGRCFIGPHAYKTTYELKFKKGKFISSKETSGTYEGF